MSRNCLFCKLQDTEQVLWRNDCFFIIFDNVPVNPGHLLVIPLKHTVSLLELNEIEWSRLFESVKQGHSILKNTDLIKTYQDMLLNVDSHNSKKFIQEALKTLDRNILPDGFNYGVNEGRSAGRTVDHLHWHIIPRYKGDVRDPIGGVRGVIPKRGNYKKI